MAGKLDDIYKTGKLAHVELDERALDALKEFPVDGALNVLSQFLESNLEHVSNKSAYLCGVMKTYRQKSRATQQGVATPTPAVLAKGPDEEKIKLILERTGYTLDVTTGKHKPAKTSALNGSDILRHRFSFRPIASRQANANTVVRHRIGTPERPVTAAKCSAARYRRTCSRTSWYRCSRSAAPSGTCDWWWTRWPAPIAAMRSSHSPAARPPRTPSKRYGRSCWG